MSGTDPSISLRSARRVAGGLIVAALVAIAVTWRLRSQESAAIVLPGVRVAQGGPVPAWKATKSEFSSSVPIVLLLDQGVDPASTAVLRTAAMLGTGGPVLTKVIDDYRVGDLAHSRGVAYLGMKPRSALPEPFLHDLLDGSQSRPLVWIGANVELLTEPATEQAFARRYGWLAGPDVLDVGSISYHGVVLPRPEGAGAARSFVALDASRVLIRATLTDVVAPARPWAVSSENLVYISDAPLGAASATDAGLVTAELVAQTLAPASFIGPRKESALLVVTGIDPATSPLVLQDVVHRLAAARRPFVLVVNPVASVESAEVLLSDRPKLVEALRSARSNGATLSLDVGVQGRFTEERWQQMKRAGLGDVQIAAAGGSGDGAIDPAVGRRFATVLFTEAVDTRIRRPFASGVGTMTIPATVVATDSRTVSIAFEAASLAGRISTNIVAVAVVSINLGEDTVDMVADRLARSGFVLRTPARL